MPDRLHNKSDTTPGGKKLGRELITDLPLHGKASNDLDKLVGPMEFVPGEKLQWNYPFAWPCRAPNGQIVTLQKGQVVKYLGRAGNNLQLSVPGAPSFVAAIPPNLALSAIVTFAAVPVTLCDKVMIENRLGKPTSERKDLASGGSNFVYDAGNWNRKWTDNDVVSTYVSDGYSPTRSYNTYIPRHESEDYTPYHFVVRFDAQDQVVAVEDLAVAR